MRGAPNPPEEFEPWETEAIQRIVVAFFSSTTVPPSIDLNDLLQEAFIHWSSRRKTFRATGGAAPPTYLERVVSRGLISLQREWRAAKRGRGEPASSLDQPLGRREEGDALTLADLLMAPAHKNSDLALDIARVVPKLTPRQLLVMRGLADQLELTEIARRLGLSRDTVNEERNRIRAVLTDAGLREYLA